jgi:thiamine phosphate synthase YjbQ (UPF0047 family)
MMIEIETRKSVDVIDITDRILRTLQRIAPRGASYLHDKGDGNAHAHLQATLLGNSLMIHPIP